MLLGPGFLPTYPTKSAAYPPIQVLSNRMTRLFVFPQFHKRNRSGWYAAPDLIHRAGKS